MKHHIIVRQVEFRDDAYVLFYEVGEDVYEPVPESWAVQLGLANNDPVPLEAAMGRLRRARRQLSSVAWPPDVAERRR